ncbi:MAG: hypothetical protein GF364_19815 [Candidatus Lokiarchaeota archaeon]|nr:hypothetical protein [Candidatus Lokiarchaeota archaeon]
MRGNTIKILSVGSRYTGKGQIGRIWAETEADLPTLQPVILYERKVLLGKKFYRVVIWVVSYDLEFKDIRHCFYNNPIPDGIIYSFDLTDKMGQTIEDLNLYKEEISNTIEESPPSLLIGVKLLKKTSVSKRTKLKAQKWNQKNGNMPYVEIDYTNKKESEKKINKCFDALLKEILK